MVPSVRGLAGGVQGGGGWTLGSALASGSLLGGIRPLPFCPGATEAAP